MNNLIWKKKPYLCSFLTYFACTQKRKKKRKKPISMFIFVLNLPSDKTLNVVPMTNFLKLSVV